MLPIKTTIEDIDALTIYLRSQVGWVPLDRVKKTIDSRLADNRKLEAAKRLGLLDRDGTNIKLTDRGREYASGTDEAAKRPLVATAIREVPLYLETVEWIHHSKIENPTRTDVGNYWHDKHAAQLEGAQGAALTDAVIFFMRVVGAAGLGKFNRAGGGHPEAYLKTDAAAIESFVTGTPAAAAATPLTEPTPPNSKADDRTSTTQAPPLPPTVSVEASPAVHVNIEIHIAADAKAETVAEIFKNMRKYVLSNPDDVNS